MYQAALKSLIQPYNTNQSSHLQIHPAHRQASLYECLALSHLRCNQYTDAIYCMLRVVHLDPSASHSWYNHAYLREELAAQMMRKQQRSLKDIELSIREFETAGRMFKYMANITPSYSSLNGLPQSLKYDSQKVSNHQIYCEVNFF
jgi:hypothetical protein